ncbi:hypothetical protein CF319_g7271 [Tilletia indica]|nr:hypothetical protein CF319_g7271 [Tilletia indica]
MIGVFLLFQQAPASVHCMLQHLGISISRQRSIDPLRQFNEKSLLRARALTADTSRVKVLLFDNVDIYIRTFQQNILHSNILLNLAMRTLLVLPALFHQSDVSSEHLKTLRQARRLTMENLAGPESGNFMDQLCRIQVAESLLVISSRQSRAPQKKKVVEIVREDLKCLRASHSLLCLAPEATTTIALPLLDVDEGSTEGVAELLEDSALLLGVLESSSSTDIESTSASNFDVAATAPEVSIGVQESIETVPVCDDVQSMSTESSVEYCLPPRLTSVLETDGILLAVGDLKSHRTVESAQSIRSQHDTKEERLEYVQSLFAPWHLVLNWVYAIFKAHFAKEGVGQDVALERCRDALRRSRTLLREEEPSFTEAWTLIKDVFAGRVQNASQ